MCRVCTRSHASPLQPTEGTTVKAFIQKAVLFLVIAFCLFYLITRPADAANAVRGFFGAFESLFTFFATLASG